MLVTPTLKPVLSGLFHLQSSVSFTGQAHPGPLLATASVVTRLEKGQGKQNLRKSNKKNTPISSARFLREGKSTSVLSLQQMVRPRGAIPCDVE